MNPLPEPIQDLAILYGSEGLSPPQAEELARWRAGASGPELAEFAALADLAGELAAPPQTVEAPPALKEAILGSLDHADGIPDAGGEDAVAQGGGEFETLCADATPWQPLPMKGVSVRELSDRPEDGHTTFLLKLDAGARFPTHRHRGAECVYLISGDLRSGGVELAPGDFQRAGPGSKHSELYSEGGCVALVVTSHDNFPRRRLAAWKGLRSVARKLAGALGGGRE